MTPTTPFTLAEAEEIREDFEDLIDTEFKIGSSPLLLVADVVVAPFNDEDKNRLVAQYQAKNNENSLSDYAGPHYDVLLITSENDDDVSYSYIDIRAFADLRGIKYAFPG